MDALPAFVLTTPISGPRNRFREMMEAQAHRFGQDPAYTFCACALCEWVTPGDHILCLKCGTPVVKLAVSRPGEAPALVARIRDAVRDHGQETWTPLAKLVVQACIEDYFYRPKSGFAKQEEGLDGEAAIRAAIDMDITKVFSGMPVRIDSAIPTGMVRGVTPTEIVHDEMAKLGGTIPALGNGDSLTFMWKMEPS